MSAAPSRELSLAYDAFQVLESGHLRLLEVDARSGFVTALATSSDGVTVYRVSKRNHRWQCSCPGKSFAGHCKHIRAAQAVT
jgi:hypothetical protein